MKILVIIPLLAAGTMFSQQTEIKPANTATTTLTKTSKVEKNKIVLKNPKAESSQKVVKADVKNANGKGVIVNVLEQPIIEQKNEEKTSSPK